MTQDRARATRQAVLLAAAKVFERHGFSSATIAEILDEAGVTKGAMYFHFDSKESLARAIVEEQSSWQGDRGDTATSPLQGIIEICHAFVSGLQHDPLLRASIRLTLERNTFGATDAGPYEGWLSSVTEILEDAKGRGELVADADPARVAHLLISAVTGTQLVSEALTGRHDLMERIDDMLSVVLRPVAAPSTYERLQIHSGSSTRAS